MSETKYEPRAGSAGGKALAAIRAHGQPVSEEALSVVLDLEKSEVQAFLAYPLKMGVLVRTKGGDNCTWYSEGGGVPVPHQADPPLEPNRRPEPPLAEIPVFTTLADAERSLAAPGESWRWSAPASDTPQPVRGPDHFECAIFSDGRFVIELGDQVVRLNTDQTDKLVRYIDRLAAVAA